MVSTDDDDDEIIGREEDERRLSMMRAGYEEQQQRNSSVRSQAVESAMTELGRGICGCSSSGAQRRGSSRRGSSRRGSGLSGAGGSRRSSIPEMLAEIGIGIESPTLSGPPGVAGDKVFGAEGFEYERESGHEEEEEEQQPHRPSVVVRRGSAWMFDSSIRKAIKGTLSPFGGMLEEEGTEEDERAQALREEAIEEEERRRSRPSNAQPSGLLVEMSRLTDTKLNGGRGYMGILEEGGAIHIDDFICALTSPCWQGVASVMAIDGFDQELSGWAPPEYHIYVTSILCAYKSYLLPDELLTHLTTLYVQLGSINLPPSAPQARAAQTVRERVLYVLLLWARRHPDDFDPSTPIGLASKGGGGGGSGGNHRARVSISASNSRRSMLTQFVEDALAMAEEEYGMGGGGELARCLTALQGILAEHAPFSFGAAATAANTPGGARDRAFSSPSHRLSRESSNGSHYLGGEDSDGSTGSNTGPQSRLSLGSGGGGRSRAATFGNGSPLNPGSEKGLSRFRGRSDSGRSLLSGENGEREWGVDYWRRLLAAPSNAERGFVRELAEQLAVHENALLRTVRPSELQSLAFAKANKHERSPNVQMLIQHFNRISRWVCTQVVKQPTVKERARCVRLYIELARASHELGNLNGVMEIVAALNSAALYRLKRTWDGLPKASRRDFDELCNLVKPERSHASLRSEMKRAARRGGGAVPYLGLYLTDLTFIEDGNPNFLEADDGTGESLVNLGKCAMLGKVLGEVLTFQTAYQYESIETNESLALYFTSLDPPEDDEIYTLSLTCEPREEAGGGGEAGAPPAVGRGSTRRHNRRNRMEVASTIRHGRS